MKNDDLIKNVKPEEVEAFERSNNGEHAKIVTGRLLARWFECEITIRLFGAEIFHWKFPPDEK